MVDATKVQKYDEKDSITKESAISLSLSQQPQFYPNPKPGFFFSMKERGSQKQGVSEGGKGVKVTCPALVCFEWGGISLLMSIRSFPLPPRFALCMPFDGSGELE